MSKWDQPIVIIVPYAADHGNYQVLVEGEVDRFLENYLLIDQHCKNQWWKAAVIKLVTNTFTMLIEEMNWLHMK